jgi:hypothetical protein
MRVLIALVALAAMPFAAGVAQGTNPFSDPKNCGAHLNFSDKAAAHRADAALPHGGIHGVMDRPCGPEAPPPPPPPAPGPSCAVTPPSTSGSASATGMVFRNASPWDGLAGWCINLTGPVNATVMTDANGRYAFTGLPAGSYVVCEVVQDGWRQTFVGGTASCPTGMGYSFALVTMSSFLDFGNVTP